MLTPGTLLYFDPFVFKNGAAPQVNDYSESALRPMVANMRILGQMNPLLFSNLLQCLKKAVGIRRKYLKWL